LSAKLLAHSPFRTQRAVVRRMIEADLPNFRAYRANPELAKYQGWSPMSETEAASFITDVAGVDSFVRGGWIQLGIADVETDQLLGDIGIFLAEDEQTAEIGFTLNTNVQGKGIATDAVRAALQMVFATSSAQTVRAITDARNRASIRLLERLQFAFVSTTETVFKGEPCTEHTYELSRQRLEQA
jgi:RimJ/RimL family protein N-acetyltransferase